MERPWTSVVRLAARPSPPRLGRRAEAQPSDAETVTTSSSTLPISIEAYETSRKVSTGFSGSASPIQAGRGQEMDHRHDLGIGR
jgi:hypothetical protein